MWNYSESSNSHVTWVPEEEEKEDKPEKYSEKKKDEHFLNLAKRHKPGNSRGCINV